MKFIRLKINSVYELIKSPTLSGISLRNGIGSLGIRVVSVLLAFLTNVILARNIGTGEYGLFAYMIGWLNILLIIGIFGFDKLIVRQIAIYKSHKEWGKLKAIHRFAGVRMLGISITVSLVLCGLVYLNSSIQAWRLPPTFYWIAAAIPIVVTIRLQQATLHGLNFIALGQLPEYVLQPAALLILILATNNTVNHLSGASFIMLLYIIASSFSLVVGNLLVNRYLPAEIHEADPILDHQNWTASLVPLMLVGLIFILNDQVATVLLGLLSTTKQVAIFSAADKWARFSVFMLIALNPVLAPIFAGLYSQNKMERVQWIVTISSRIIALFGLFPLLMFIAAPQFLLSLFGNEFTEGRLPLIILGASQFVNAFAGSVGILLSMTGHERTVVRGAGWGVLLNTLFCVLLIPTSGATGAAIATAASIIFTNVSLSIFVYQKLGIFPTALGSIFKKA